ncbi:hypothetical protein U9M48_017629, partial [Paspalum notatum var. saurae]
MSNNPIHRMATTTRRLLVAVVLLFTVTPALSLGEKFVVGERKHGWAPNVNYTEWAEQHQFHVGDWLGRAAADLAKKRGEKKPLVHADFEYQRDMFDVVQVNETAYAACDGSSPILSYSRGHSFVFRLNRTGRFYFICSRGYCWGGMKLSVLVHPPEPLPPAVTPSSDASRGRAGAASGAWWCAALAALLGVAAAGPLTFRMRELGVPKRNVVERTGRWRYNITPMLCLHALQINAATERRETSNENASFESSAPIGHHDRPSSSSSCGGVSAGADSVAARIQAQYAEPPRPESRASWGAGATAAAEADEKSLEKGWEWAVAAWGPRASGWSGGGACGGAARRRRRRQHARSRPMRPAAAKLCDFAVPLALDLERKQMGRDPVRRERPHRKNRGRWA